MTRSIGGTGWSPDGKSIAFVSNISGRNNLWIVPADGGWPVQLTISDQRKSRHQWGLPPQLAIRRPTYSRPAGSSASADPAL